LSLDFMLHMEMEPMVFTLTLTLLTITPLSHYQVAEVSLLCLYLLTLQNLPYLIEMTAYYLN
jgi:hypothetical protein